MNILSMDLEMNKPNVEIIQIGACVFDLEHKVILERLNVLIHTTTPIDPFISTLTGITQERNDSSHVTLMEGYDLLKDMHTRHQCFRNTLTWGGGDSIELKKQLGAPDDNWVFGRRWIDAKTIYQSYCFANNLKVQSGLKKSCHRMGVTFEGPAHDALQDAINTAYIYAALLKKLSNIKYL